MLQEFSCHSEFTMMRWFAKHSHLLRHAIAAPAQPHVNSKNKELRLDLAVDDAVRA
jgi:hypothetical protein